MPNIKEFVEQIWKLPPPEKRRSGLLPPKWFLPVYRSDRDTDYLLGKLLNFVLYISLILIFAILLDAHLAAGIFVNATEFQNNKLLLPIIFSRLIGLPAFLLSLLFYLRIRLSIDLCRDDIPVGGKKEWTLTIPRRKWIRSGVIMMFTALLCIFLSHIIVLQVVLHYKQEDSITFIIFPQLFAVAALITGAILLPLGALIFEKAIRYFPSLQENVRRNHEFLIQTTDNPHNNKGEF